MGEPEPVAPAVRRFSERTTKSERLTEDASRLVAGLDALFVRIEAMGNVLHGARDKKLATDVNEIHQASIKTTLKQAQRVLDRCGEELTVIEGGL